MWRFWTPSLPLRRRELAGSRMSARAANRGSRRWPELAPAEEEAFARRLAERERRAKRLLRARVLDSRLESGRRLAEQRCDFSRRSSAPPQPSVIVC
jgi:hypothetical protein